MKITQSAVLSPNLADQVQRLGAATARLRLARGIRQTDAALRAGLSRNTAYRLEKGEPGIAIGQILRYLDAIAPGKTLLSLLNETDPALTTLRAKEARRRARGLTRSELKKIDF
jgi:transcriptional regulator with XRE-family HTH domain